MSNTEILEQNNAEHFNTKFLTGLGVVVDSMCEADGNANTTLNDLAEYGLTTRRDALNVTDAVFEEAERALYAGEDSQHLTAIGQNVLSRVNTNDEVRVHNFLFELDSYHEAPYLTQKERKVVAEVLGSDLNDPSNIGKYAVVRANVRERYVQQEFGREFESAKQDTKDFLQNTLLEFGLSEIDIQSATERIKKTKLAAQDHLDAPVTGTSISGLKVLGDYKPGSLQVHVYLNQTPQGVEVPALAEARKTMIHELVHAGSSQPMEVIESNDGAFPKIIAHRTGLMSKYGDFRPVNEGLTEFLARLTNKESIVTDGSRPYDAEVSAIAHLASEDPKLFAVLIQSAFGSNLHQDLPKAIAKYFKYRLVA